MVKNKNILVKETEINLITVDGSDFISLTDIAKYKEAVNTDDIIKNWLRNRNTIELLGFWETINNPDFKPVEFEGFRKQAGLNSFVMSSKKWIEATKAIGIISKSGRNGGTFAHKDIAFEFASWISIEFKFYIIKEFQRLKADENDRLKLDWSLHRTLAKINYHIHTDAIKENLIPNELSKAQINFVYAEEADLLNVALFGMTAKQWRDLNPGKSGNIRDQANIEQLLVLSNLESINAVFINQNLNQADRLQQLNKIAISQMQSLLNHAGFKRIK